MAVYDKFGQEFELGSWVLRPEPWGSGARIVIYRVCRLTGKSAWLCSPEDYGNSVKEDVRGSLCKIPERCIIVPEIVANYWSVLK